MELAFCIFDFSPRWNGLGKKNQLHKACGTLAAIMKTNSSKKTFILGLVLMILGSSCDNSKSVDKYGMTWRKTGYDLWISQNGKLAIKSFDVSDGVTKKNVFIDQFPDGKSLNSIVDTITFKDLGNYFFKDKNHVYKHYDMSDGGHFIIVDRADPKTFIIINDCYAKDKTSIYCQRLGRLDMVDYKTFKTTTETGCFAKDKNGFYFQDEKIDTTNTDVELQKIIKKLKKLK
jgi:hypothetical protein